MIKMAKNTLEWHKNCLKNMIISLQKDKEELKRKQDEVLTFEDRVTFYKIQIERTKKENKDGFDREKFNVKR